MNKNIEQLISEIESKINKISKPKTGYYGHEEAIYFEGYDSGQLAAYEEILEKLKTILDERETVSLP